MAKSFYDKIEIEARRKRGPKQAHPECMPYRKLDVGVVIGKPVSGVALFGCQILRVLQQNVLKLRF